MSRSATTFSSTTCSTTNPVSGGDQALVRLAAHLYSGEACDVIGELIRIDDTNYATVMKASTPTGR